jgi:hypothetical protein
MKQFTPCFLKFFLSLSFVSMAFTGFADGFKVSGTFVTDITVTHTSNSYLFYAQVDGCCWKIHVEPSESTKTNSGIQFYEDSYDGTYSYSYIQFLKQTNSKVSNTSQALIGTNSVPCEQSMFSIPIWLAYCSSCYFKSASTNQMEDLFDSGDSATRVAHILRKYNRTIYERSPHLPISADFFSDGIIYSRGDENQLRRQQLPRPFSRGYKMAMFRSIDFTNIGGAFVPSMFTIERFLPGGIDAKSSNDVRTIGVWTGKIDSITAGWHSQPRDFIPDTDGSAYTIDRRFPLIGKSQTWIDYINTNKEIWLSITNKALLNIYSNAIQNEVLLYPPPVPEVKYVTIFKTIFDHVNNQNSAPHSEPHKIRHPMAKGLFVGIMFALVNLPWIVIVIIKLAKRRRPPS